MKRLVTISFSGESKPRQIAVLISLLFIATLFACSSVYPQEEQINSDDLTPEKSFSFKENGSYWKVDFNDDKISALYKDGVKIPSEEIDQYKKMIYKNLNKLTGERDYLVGIIPKLNFDSDKLKEDIEKLRENFNKDKFFNFKHDFDKGKFKEDMKKFEEQMKRFNEKELDMYFDSEKFKEKMKELENLLKKLPVLPFYSEPDCESYLEIINLEDDLNYFSESFSDL